MATVINGRALIYIWILEKGRSQQVRDDNTSKVLDIRQIGGPYQGPDWQPR